MTTLDIFSPSLTAVVLEVLRVSVSRGECTNGIDPVTLEYLAWAGFVESRGDAGTGIIVAEAPFSYQNSPKIIFEYQVWPDRSMPFKITRTGGGLESVEIDMGYIVPYDHYYGHDALRRSVFRDCLGFGWNWKVFCKVNLRTALLELPAPPALPEPIQQDKPNGHVIEVVSHVTDVSRRETEKTKPSVGKKDNKLGTLNFAALFDRHTTQ